MKIKMRIEAIAAVIIAIVAAISFCMGLKKVCKLLPRVQRIGVSLAA
jgi:hypothetical protein